MAGALRPGVTLGRPAASAVLKSVGPKYEREEVILMPAKKKAKKAAKKGKKK